MTIEAVTSPWAARSDGRPTVTEVLRVRAGVPVLVCESNRSGHVWFAADLDALDARPAVRAS
ncbi:hypothetical protein [Microbispora sp. KK1-11]|uniref:hypothetical protein n=1 Tax=Microbispora sp. KK1-11 TaxID=2053005 RepID=UPI00115869C7|nr:hypothetical protein [Microbispora sp. KK1-11]TQS25238.1 hypothetical protein FLW16_31160 [Microbispora sp. KK1-11]